MKGSSGKISAFDWNPAVLPEVQGHHALFNSESLASANRLVGHDPFSIEVNKNIYLAYKRHASAVIGGLSLKDMVTLLQNLPETSAALEPRGIRSLSLNTMNAVNDPEALATAINMSSGVRFEFLLDISRYTLNKLSQNHKRNIKKAAKSGASINLPVDMGAVRNHIDLVNTNLDNKGLGGISNSPEYFRKLIESSSGLLAQVIQDGQLLASTFFIKNPDYAYYHSSGTSDSGKKIGAAYFLVDCMIAEMRTRQMRYLNFGGCTSEQTGLCRFKMGFRPETRVLASASRKLVVTGRQKIRSLLSTRPEDILSINRVRVYKKLVSKKPSDNLKGYTLRRMSYQSLFEVVCATPELSPCFEIFFRSRPLCYALSGDQEQVLAIGFVETAQTNPNSDGNKRRLSGDVGEIAHFQVVNSMLGKGGGELLLGLLEQELLRLGFSKVVRRVSVQDVASQELILAAGFEFVGEEKVVATAIMGGGSRILNEVQA